MLFSTILPNLPNDECHVSIETLEFQYRLFSFFNFRILSPSGTGIEITCVDVDGLKIASAGLDSHIFYYLFIFFCILLHNAQSLYLEF